MAKTRLIRTPDEDNGTLSFVYRAPNNEGGHEVTETVTVAVDDVYGDGTMKALKKLPNGQMAIKTFMAGMNTRFGDVVYQTKDPNEGMQRIKEAVEQVKSGQWSLSRGAGSTKPTLFHRAIAQIKGITPEEAKARYEALPEKDQENMKHSAKIAAAKAEIRAKDLEQKAGQEEPSALDNL